MHEVAGQPFARYVGTLPCADCAGNRWDLVLYARSRDAEPRFSLLRTRLRAAAGMSERTIELRGTWSMRAPSALSLGADEYRLQPDTPEDVVTLLHVGDNRLRVIGRGGDTNGQGMAVLQRVQPTRDADAVDVGAGDARTPIRLQAGQALRVHLPGSLATGYRWDLDTLAPSPLRIESDPGSDSAPAVDPRAGSVRSWSFRAQQAGSARLRFDYHRSWEATGMPEQSVEFDVIIR
jgi:predicted secreted protein